MKNVADPKSYTGKVTSLAMSVLYLEQGDREESLNWLERSFQKRDLMLAFIKVDSRFDPLRNEARFQAIVAGMGL